MRPGATGPPGPTGATGATGARARRGDRPGRIDRSHRGRPARRGPGIAGPAGGGTLAGRVTPAINASQTTFTAVLDQEWPTGPVDQRVLVDNELMRIISAVARLRADVHVDRATGILGTAAAYAQQQPHDVPAAAGLVDGDAVATGTATVGTSQQAARADHDHGVTGGGGGSSTLDGLSDVDVDTPADGQALA